MADSGDLESYYSWMSKLTDIKGAMAVDFENIQAFLEGGQTVAVDAPPPQSTQEHFEQDIPF